MTAEISKPVINIADVALRERAHGEDCKALVGRAGNALDDRDGA